MDELTRLRGEAQTAGGEAGKLQESIPGLLSGLKSNLTSIFSQDNPMMQERENALQTFLNVPSQTRAGLLPANLPMVEGSNLNLSPTQQNALVTASRNAALVPLAGLNQSIVGQYGNIGDILGNAANMYASSVTAAQNRASIAQQAFQNALAQEQEARQGRTAAGGGLDLTALLTALMGGNQQERPDPAQFDQPDIPQEISIPGQTGTIQPYTPLEVPKLDFSFLNPLTWFSGAGGGNAVPTNLVNPTTSIFQLAQQPSLGPFKQ